MTSYKKTNLWKNAARRAKEADCCDAWQKLEMVYDGFWDKAVKVAAKIANDLPGLTLHDEAHLAAVWDTADKIAGPDFPMTPLEVFVFGGAVILHDLGHTVAAYEGGLPGIRKTAAWRDAVLWRLDLDDDAPDPSEDELENPDPGIAKAALFDTLRMLHAEQAEKLCMQRFDGPYGEIALIEDAELRHHLGQLIGKIAASHHWDREDLKRKLGMKLGGIGSAPTLGIIEPVKLACLLRSSDACQIDQRRAPDFDHALHGPGGVSRHHWDAQNRLSPPFIDKDSLVFTASPNFEEAKADAWWVAHDLVQVAHTELQECEALMRDQDLPSFCVNGVAGASDPLALAEHIRTDGWSPVDASLRVSDPRRMVEMFGGKQYYGEDALWVPLRELLQNGIDAIEARRVLEKGFEGRILVEQEPAELDDKKGYWLHVSDDGIGMSERVLTRTLVDFGRSAKKSGELKAEYQDLLGKKVPTIGQFGIGFFSVLMLSDHVIVQSRPYDKGHDAIKKLRFTWGVESRPLLLAAEPDKLRGMSTKVSLFVEEEIFSRLRTSIMPNFRALPETEQAEYYKGGDLAKCLQRIAPLPNCRIDVRGPNSPQTTIRSPKMYRPENAEDWLQSIRNDDAHYDISKAASYLTPLSDQSGKTVGWGMIDFCTNEYVFQRNRCLRLEKGLSGQRSRSSERLFSEHIIGAMPTFASAPSRSIAERPRGKAFDIWLASQLDKIQPDDFSGLERDVLSENIYALGGDPIDFAVIGLRNSKGKFVQLSVDRFLDQYLDFFKKDYYLPLLKKQGRELFKKWEDIKNDPHFIINLSESGGNIIYSLPNIINNLFNRYERTSAFFYRSAQSYSNPDAFSLLGCLRRQCERKRFSLDLRKSNQEILIGYDHNFRDNRLEKVVSVNHLQLRIHPLG